MTLLQFIDAHPWWSFFALLIVCLTLSDFAAALGRRRDGR